MDYRRELFPGTYKALASVLVLPLNEMYEPEHVEFVVQSIREIAAGLQKS